MKRWMALAVLLLPLAAQQGDRWQGIGPHDVPHCDIPPRAAKSPGTTAPCTCPGMVSGCADNACKSHEDSRDY